MNELIRPQRELTGNSGGLGSIFDADSPTPTVLVTSGLFHANFPVNNTTIGELRRRLQHRLDIDPQAQAILDGHEAGDDVIVRAGQAIMFTRRGGEKGV